MMNIRGKGYVYQNQYGYTISDNNKKQDGTWEKFFIPLKFPRSMRDLPRGGDFIEIDGFITHYKDQYNRVNSSYMVTGWKLASNSRTNNSTPTQQVSTQQQFTQTQQAFTPAVETPKQPDPYEEFANEYIIGKDDLPF